MFAPDSSLLEAASLLGLVLAVAVALATLVRFGGDWLDPLRERFVLGVPWGTATVVVGLYLVYYLVQGGGDGPIVQGFRSWSLWYPQGTLFSSFAHASDGHLRGNVFGALAFAPIVEFAWRHHPTAGARIEHPAARIGAFVGGVLLVGLAGAVFVPGAIIGFSGVVFAFAGFALVVRPLATVLAILGIRAVRLVYSGFTDPLVTATARPAFVSPSWAGTALQGHLFGVLVGVLLGIGLLRMRGARPRLDYVFFAALVFAVSRSLHAVYWYLGADEFLLFQAAGVAGVVLFATLVALATLPPDRRLRVGPSPATVAVGVLVAAVVLLGVAGLAYSLVTVSPGEDVEGGIEVEDYTVAYVDGVEDRYIGAVTVPGVGNPLSATTSGVVVASDRRNVWGVDVTAGELAFDGRARVAVGDATWRETVLVERTGWSFLDGNATYRVTASHGDRQQLLHLDSPAVGEFRLDNATLAIHPTAAGHDLHVTRDGSTVATVPVPADGETVTVEGITIERDDDDLFASQGETEFRVAQFERGQRG